MFYVFCWISYEMKETLNIIINGVYQAGARLFMIGVAYIIYSLGRTLSKELKTKMKCFLVLFCFSAFIGLLSYSTHGSHIENEDPLFGVGGETIQDFEPTDAERLESGVMVFVVSYTLFIIGAVRGFRENKEALVLADLLSVDNDADRDKWQRIESE